MSNPFGLSDFFDRLPIDDMTFDCHEPQEVNRLGDGSVIKGGLGAALWRGRIMLRSMARDQARRFESALGEIAAPGGAFLLRRWPEHGPSADPAGTILGAATPTIHTLDADNRRLRVQGLPAGYVLTIGDMIGWSYGSSPVRLALHRVTSTATADGSGVTPLFSVWPHIRPGVVTGAAVVLMRPVCKAIITNAQPATRRRGWIDGGAFDFIQTLR